MLSQKKREALDARIKRADLKKYHYKGWSKADHDKGVALIRDALFQGNSAESMLYVLLHGDVLFALHGLEDYRFENDLGDIEFVDDAIAARNAAERCALLTFMCELLVESKNDGHVHEVQRTLVQGFVFNRVVPSFPENTEGHYVADLLDDSMRNSMEEVGCYATTEAVVWIAKALEKLAAGL